jgi:hypothetical protein
LQHGGFLSEADEAAITAAGSAAARTYPPSVVDTESGHDEPGHGKHQSAS